MECTNVKCGGKGYTVQAGIGNTFKRIQCPVCEANKKIEEEKQANLPMTEFQIENFRKVLIGIVGSYALIMPKEEVIAIRDKMQHDMSEYSKKI